MQFAVRSRVHSKSLYSSLTLKVNDNDVLCSVPRKSESRQSTLPKLQPNRPTLPTLSLSRNNHAVHIRDVSHNENKQNRVNRGRRTSISYSSNIDILQQFQNVPLIKYKSIISVGFIRRAHSNVPLEITTICQQYVCHSDDELFQIAFRMFCCFEKVKRSSFSVKMIYVVIADYLKTNNMRQIQLYSRKLIKSNYLKPCNATKKVYQFPMASKLCLISVQNQFKQ